MGICTCAACASCKGAGARVCVPLMVDELHKVPVSPVAFKPPSLGSFLKRPPHPLDRCLHPTSRICLHTELCVHASPQHSCAEVRHGKDAAVPCCPAQMTKKGGSAKKGQALSLHDFITNTPGALPLSACLPSRHGEVSK
eukprot:1020193-Pelagomonas_calceolata.AAC.3